MKNFIKIISAAVLAMAILGSCKKENNDTPTPTAPATFFKCTIDGSNWSSNGANVALDIGSTMQISGTTLTGSSIMLIIQAPFQVGTYIANPNTMNTFTYVKGFAGSPYSTQEGIGQGTLNITAISASKIEGTFQFTGENWDGDVKQITAGSFKTNIQ